MARVPEGFGVRRRPDRSVRMQPGEATLDPGMRAQAGQFTDVTSPGYARQAAAQAERGGAMEFGTSAEAMRDKERDDLVMSVVGAVLAMMAGAGGVAGAGPASARGWGAPASRGGYTPSAGAKFHGMTGQPINAGVSRLGGRAAPPSPPTPFQGTTAQTRALQSGQTPTGWISAQDRLAGQFGMPPGRQLPPASFRGTTMVDPVSSAGLLEFLRRRR